MPLPTVEKTYYEKHDVKVTNMRFCFYKEIFPLEFIDNTYVHHRVCRLTISIFCFFFSLYSLTYGTIGIVIVAFFFFWLSWEYTHYLELFVTVKGKKIKVKHGGISGSRFIYEIEDAIDLAREDNKKIRESGEYEHTDSMKFSLKMKELEC